jgi:peptide/nickel transport system substrate-binding protein
MKFRLMVAVAAAGLMAALSACGGSTDGAGTGGGAASGTPVRGGTMTYAVDLLPSAGGIDPMVATLLASQSVMTLTYDTLLTRDDDGTIQPSLAASYQQVDDTTYTFDLRKDVKFADGSPFTAADVVYSFDTYATAKTSNKAYISSVKSVTATGDYQVTMKLSHPDNTLLNVLSSPGLILIVGKDGYGNASADDRQKHSYGTGPFVVSDWTDGVSMTLTRNPNYWKSGQPYLDKVVLKMIPDDSARLAAVQEGSVQAAWFADGSVAKQAAGGDWKEGKAYSTQSLPIYLNPETGPLKDVRVRRALSLALDREKLVKVAMFGNGDVSFITAAGDPASPKPTSDTPYYSQDIDEAKKLLAEAGQPNPTIQLWYFGDAAQSQHPIYELMQQQAAQAGIKLDLKAKSVSELSPIFTANQSFTDMVSLPAGYRPDPLAAFDQFLSESGYANHWKGNADAAKAMDLLAQAKSTTDAAEKKTLLQQLDDEVTDQALVIVPMSVPAHFEVWNSSQVQGYDTDPYGSRYKLASAWLSK